MKLAKQIAEEHYRLPRAIRDLNHPMAKGMLENIVAAKLGPIRDAIAEMAGPCEHMGSGGLRCIELEEYDGDTVCLPCRANALLAMFEDAS